MPNENDQEKTIQDAGENKCDPSPRSRATIKLNMARKMCERSGINRMG